MFGKIQNLSLPPTTPAQATSQANKIWVNHFRRKVPIDPNDKLSVEEDGETGKIKVNEVTNRECSVG